MIRSVVSSAEPAPATGIGRYATFFVQTGLAYCEGGVANLKFGWARKVKMGRRPDDRPIWHTFGASLAAFAVGVQLVLSGLLLGAQAGPAAQGDLSLICAHDPAAVDQTAPGSPAPSKSHDLCPACTCLQSGKLVSTLPASPVLTVLRGRSEAMPARRVAAGAWHRLRSPYGSRAPPSFA